jgi:hypothetical protein
MNHKHNIQSSIGHRIVIALRIKIGSAILNGGRCSISNNLPVLVGYGNHPWLKPVQAERHGATDSAPQAPDPLRAVLLHLLQPTLPEDEDPGRNSAPSQPPAPDS